MKVRRKCKVTMTCEATIYALIDDKDNEIAEIEEIDDIGEIDDIELKHIIW